MPEVTVKIPIAWRQLTGEQVQARVQGSTAGEVLTALQVRFPALATRLFDEAGEIKRYITVFVDGEDVRELDGKDTPIKAGDEVVVMPAMAGGAGPDLSIGPELLTAMVDHCRRELPNEACGFLGGRSGVALTLYPVKNADPSPEWFVLDPKDQMRAFRAMDDVEEELVAVYHSHPVDPARPSADDIANAHYPDVINVIISLMGDQPEVRAYFYKGDGAEEVRLKEDGTASR